MRGTADDSLHDHQTDVTNGRVETINRLFGLVGARLSDPEAPVTNVPPVRVPRARPSRQTPTGGTAPERPP
jgi:hypothetical protein